MEILDQGKTTILRDYKNIYVRERYDGETEVVAEYAGNDNILVVLGRYPNVGRAKEILGNMARAIGLGLHMFRMLEK